jgi:hypothetical protein
MVAVQVSEINLVDLVRPVSGSAQVVQEVTAACAVQHPCTTIDQDQLVAGVDEECVDRALDRR